MPDTISLTGIVATDPRHITTTDGLDITSFRLASSQRRFDRSRNTWTEIGTNWYTVTAFRQLAANMATSLVKGDRVLASGRVRIRDWQNGEKSGTTVEVEADSVGHDLMWGSSRFVKAVPMSGQAAAITADASSVSDADQQPNPSGFSATGAHDVVSAADEPPF